jgi:hypothetical protein
MFRITATNGTLANRNLSSHLGIYLVALSCGWRQVATRTLAIPSNDKKCPTPSNSSFLHDLITRCPRLIAALAWTGHAKALSIFYGRIQFLLRVPERLVDGGFQPLLPILEGSVPLLR